MGERSTPGVVTLGDVVTLERAGGFSTTRWRRLRREVREDLTAQLVEWLRRDRQECQLYYYTPCNPNALALHLSRAKVVGVKGGRKSGKTGTLLAEAAIRMTGIVPRALGAAYPRERLRLPCRVRLVVTSFVSAWDNNLKPKLQWFHWNGRPNADGLLGDPACGHWGWIPREFLVHGQWEEAWDAKHNVLSLANGSTLQVMSQDQAIQEFNQGAFDLIVEDELPPEDKHAANVIRAMELGGTVLVGGTPSDALEQALPQAWFFDQVIAPGLAGTAPTDVEAIELWMEDNRILDPAEVRALEKTLTPEQRRTRMHGDAIHLTGVVIKGFTDSPRWWCFTCVDRTWLADEACERCGGRSVVRYRHVWDEEDMVWPGPSHWPTLFYMDPHQSRPTACAWFRVDPLDRWWQVAEAEIAGDASAVRAHVEEFEAVHGLEMTWRKGDPKIAAQPNQFAQRVDGELFTIKRSFEEAGFPFEDANTTFAVALDRIEQALRPNPYTRTPRLRIHASCTRTRFQVGHFVWRLRLGAAREEPSTQHSDFPALLRYLAMDEPEYRQCQVARRREPILIGQTGTGRNRATGW